MKTTKKEMQYNVIFRPEPEGCFTALVPALPGCVSYGRTLKEAKRMVADAIGGYIASLRKHGEPIPSDEETLSSQNKEARLCCISCKRSSERNSPLNSEGGGNEWGKHWLDGLK